MASVFRVMCVVIAFKTFRKHSNQTPDINKRWGIWEGRHRPGSWKSCPRKQDEWFQRSGKESIKKRELPKSQFLLYLSLFEYYNQRAVFGWLRNQIRNSKMGFLIKSWSDLCICGVRIQNTIGKIPCKQYEENNEQEQIYQKTRAFLLECAHLVCDAQPNDSLVATEENPKPILILKYQQIQFENNSIKNTSYILWETKLLKPA